MKGNRKASRTENKSQFKLYFLIIELVALVISVGSSFWMGFTLNSKTRYEAEFTDKTSFYLDSNFDLVVSGASKQQVEEYGQKDFVQNVTSASKISLNVETGSAEDYKDLLLFDSVEDLEHSEFTEKRLIAEKKSVTNSIYADYKFCNLYHVKLGDTLAVSVNGEKKDFCISRVYRTDYSYPEGILVATKDLLALTSKSQLMYIIAKDKTKLVEDLKDYKPLGTLLSKKDNQTDEEYQKYLDEFNSKNYFDSYVTDNTGAVAEINESYSKKISSSNKSFYISVAVISIVCLGISLLCFFVNAKNKKDKIYKYIQENGSSKITSIFTTFDASFILFVAVGSFLAIYNSLSRLTAYYTFSAALANSYLCILAPIIGILVGYLITIVAIKRT